MPRRGRLKQTELRYHPRGGKREGAGRKPNGDRAGVSHLQRPQFTRALPVHVTLRVAKHVYNLRSRRAFSVIGRSLAKAAERFGMRIVQFSVLGNHMHLVVEADETAALSRAMQGFSIRLAKGLNRMMNKRGRVLGDRFHAHLLRTPTEVRRTVAYVRNNHRKHMADIGQALPRDYVDEYASEGAMVTLPSPETWLLSTFTVGSCCRCGTGASVRAGSARATSSRGSSRASNGPHRRLLRPRTRPPR